MNNKITLNHLGKIAEDELLLLPNRFADIKMDKYVIMSNHIHFVIQIARKNNKILSKTTDGADVNIFNFFVKRHFRRKMILPNVIGYFKMNSAKKINILCQTPGIPIWQRNYYEHIVRDENDYIRIIEYIENNPKNGNLTGIYVVKNVIYHNLSH